jgi:hypothetical protein
VSPRTAEEGIVNDQGERPKRPARLSTAATGSKRRQGRVPRETRYEIEGQPNTIPDDPHIKRVIVKPGSLEAQYVRADGTFRIGDYIDDLTED